MEKYLITFTNQSDWNSTNYNHLIIIINVEFLTTIHCWFISWLMHHGSFKMFYGGILKMAACHFRESAVSTQKKDFRKNIASFNWYWSGLQAVTVKGFAQLPTEIACQIYFFPSEAKYFSLSSQQTIWCKYDIVVNHHIRNISF